MNFTRHHVNVRAKDSGEVVNLLLSEGFSKNFKCQHCYLFSIDLNGAGSHFSGRAVNLLYIPDGE